MVRALFILIVLSWFGCADPSSDSANSLVPSCTTGWCWEYSVPPKMDYRAIRGTGHDNIWIVGGPQYKVILQWNGEVWTVHKHSAPGSLNGVWGSDTKSAWAVGDQGTVLAWDGSTWRLDGAAGWPDVTMDCGGWMLLRWRGEDARAHWLPFQPDACGASAHLARAALRAHGGRTQVAAQSPVERHG